MAWVGRKWVRSGPDLLSCRYSALFVLQKCWSSLSVVGSGNLDKACSLEMKEGSRCSTDRNSWTNMWISYKLPYRTKVTWKVLTPKWISKCSDLLYSFFPQTWFLIRFVFILCYVQSQFQNVKKGSLLTLRQFTLFQTESHGLRFGGVVPPPAVSCRIETEPKLITHLNDGKPPI